MTPTTEAEEKMRRLIDDIAPTEHRREVGQRLRREMRLAIEAEAAAKERARIRVAVEQADALVSTLHDFRELLPEERRPVFDQTAWRIHDLLRPLAAIEGAES